MATTNFRQAERRVAAALGKRGVVKFDHGTRRCQIIHAYADRERVHASVVAEAHTWDEAIARFEQWLKERETGNAKSE